jgi:hypothetical protein
MAYRRGDNDRPEVLGYGFIEAATWGEGMSGDHNMYQKPRSYLDEHEPVAWMHNFIENNVITHIPADIGRHPDRWTALYKDPTPCKTCQALAMAVMNDQTYHEKVTPKQWVGLTEIEICDIEADELTSANSETFSFARAIEAKLKEKNGG